MTCIRLPICLFLSSLSLSLSLSLCVCVCVSAVRECITGHERCSQSCSCRLSGSIVPSLRTIQNVESAIMKANLGLQPIVGGGGDNSSGGGGGVIRVPVPVLDSDGKKELLKVVSKIGETTKVQIRGHRKDAMQVHTTRHLRNLIIHIHSYDHLRLQLTATILTSSLLCLFSHTMSPGN